MTKLKHSIPVQNILDLLIRQIQRTSWVVTYATNKSFSAFSRADNDLGISTNINLQWFGDPSDKEGKAMISADFNYWKAQDLPSDHIEIYISCEEANHLNYLIDANTIEDWTKSGLEIPDVDIPEAA